MCFTSSVLLLQLTLLTLLFDDGHSLNIILAGGTGLVGQSFARCLNPADQVTILCRNAFLAKAPVRASSQFGWVGQKFLEKYPNVNLRDWDGGDLLDIVGQDWVGWQDDVLVNADVVVHCYGGYTEQRVMACERLVRESCRINPKATQILLSPIEEEYMIVAPSCGPTYMKQRIQQCEEMVTLNCRNNFILKIEANRMEQNCEKFLDIIDKLRVSER